MTMFEKTQALTDVFKERFEDSGMAYASLAGALLGVATEEQIDRLLKYYS